MDPSSRDSEASMIFMIARDIESSDMSRGKPKITLIINKINQKERDTAHSTFLALLPSEPFCPWP